MPATYHPSSRWSQSALVRAQWTEFQGWLKQLEGQTLDEYEMKYTSGRERIEALPRIERLRAQQSFDLWAQQLRDETGQQRKMFAQIEWDRRLQSAGLRVADWIMSEKEKKAYVAALGERAQNEVRLSGVMPDGTHPFQRINPNEFGESPPQEANVDDMEDYTRRASDAGVRPDANPHQQGESRSSSYDRQRTVGRESISSGGFNLDRRLNQNRLIQEHCRLGKQVDEECCRLEANYWTALFKIRLSQVESVWLRTEQTLNALVQENGQSMVSTEDLEKIMGDYWKSKKELEDEVTAEKKKLLAAEKRLKLEATGRVEMSRPGPVQWRQLFEQLFRSHDNGIPTHGERGKEQLGAERIFHQGSGTIPSGSVPDASSTMRPPAAQSPQEINPAVSTRRTQQLSSRPVAPGIRPRVDTSTRPEHSSGSPNREMHRDISMTSNQKPTTPSKNSKLGFSQHRNAPTHTAPIETATAIPETAVDDLDRMDTTSTDVSTGKRTVTPPSHDAAETRLSDARTRRQTMRQHQPASGGRTEHSFNHGASKSNPPPATHFEDVLRSSTFVGDQVQYSTPWLDPHHTSTAFNGAAADNQNGSWFSQSADGFNWDEVTGAGSTSERMKGVRWADDVAPDAVTGEEVQGDRRKPMAFAVFPDGKSEEVAASRRSERIRNRIHRGQQERLHAEIMEFVNDGDTEIRRTSHPR